MGLSSCCFLTQPNKSMFGSEHVLIAAGATGSPASDRHTEDSTQNAIPAASEEERRSEDSSGNATAVQHGVGHTGESSEAVPVSMRSSKPARGHQHQQQQQQQQQHNRPTSSVSEQGLNSAAGNNKSQLPGNTFRRCLPLLILFHFPIYTLQTGVCTQL
jgi:hypothetical protein